MEHFLHLLQSTMQSRWDSPALADYRSHTFTYCELAERIERFHIAFKRIGVKPGDKIALAASNSANWATAFLAITTFRATAVLILNEFTPEDTQNLVIHSDSKLLFTDSKTFGKLNTDSMPNIEAAMNIDNIQILYTTSNSITEAVNDVYKDFSARFPKGMKPADVDYSACSLTDLVAINYTSGSTGSTKGVMLSGRAISANVNFAIQEIPLPSGQRMLSMLPMAHMYGLAFEFIYPICNGACVTFLGRTPTPAILMQAFKDVRPYLLITVPLVIEKIFKGKIIPKLSTPLMRILTHIPIIKDIIYNKVRETILTTFGGNMTEIIMGGAALNPSIESVLRAIKLPYTVGYGMTECAPLIAYSHAATYVSGSCGRQVSYAEVRVDSTDPKKIDGELQVRGDVVMDGYYKNPDATKATFTEDGWLRTGDLGVIDKGGNIFIKGRSKCMILTSSGQNIYPEEIEAKINIKPIVAESLVVERNRQLVALIAVSELLAGKSEAEILPELETLRKDVNSTLPAYSQIARCEIVKEFVHTPKHSIKRFLYK